MSKNDPIKSAGSNKKILKLLALNKTFFTKFETGFKSYNKISKIKKMNSNFKTFIQKIKELIIIYFLKKQIIINFFYFL